MLSYSVPEPPEAEVAAGEAVPDEGVLVPAQVEVVQTQPSSGQPQEICHANVLLELIEQSAVKILGINLLPSSPIILIETPLFLTRSAQLPHPRRVNCSDLFPHE